MLVYKGFNFLCFAICCLCLFAAVAIRAQVITTFAGGGSSVSNGIAASSASLLPIFGEFDKQGNFYFGDAVTVAVRKIDTAGIINTVAGNGMSGFSGDGASATLAKMKNPYFCLDISGNIYIADWYNNRVRKVTAATGIINTIAGNGTASSTGDGGPATAATIVPMCLCVDNSGNIFIVDVASGVTIRRIDTSGVITTIAGSSSASGFSGDGGPATAAVIAVNFGICSDERGDIYFGCPGRIRKINVHTGIINTIAGSGSVTYNGDGMHSDSANFQPYVIALDRIGNIYIGDWNQRIRKIDTFGIIHTVAGTGVGGFGGDGGPASAAKIYNPEGIAFDACGNMYIADDNNGRIRRVSYPYDPHVSLLGAGTAAMGSAVTVTASLINAGIGYSIQWFNKGVWFATTTVPTVTYTKTMSVDSITAKVFGCSDSALSGVHVVVLSYRTGIASPASEERVAIYPNPVSGELYINGAVAIESVSITNFLGQVVYSVTEHGEQECVINTNALPAGMYFVRVGLAGGGVGIARFVKQ